MNTYQIAVAALLFAATAQTSAAWLFTELFLIKGQGAWQRRSWLAIAMAAAMLALQHGYTLELALRTSLFDLRQALLSALVSLFFALGAFGLRRQQS